MTLKKIDANTVEESVTIKKLWKKDKIEAQQARLQAEVDRLQNILDQLK